MRNTTKLAILSANTLLLFANATLADSVASNSGKDNFYHDINGRKAVQAGQAVAQNQQYITGKDGKITIKLKDCPDINMTQYQVVTIVPNSKVCPAAKDLTQKAGTGGGSTTYHYPAFLPLVAGLAAGALLQDSLKASP